MQEEDEFIKNYKRHAAKYMAAREERLAVQRARNIWNLKRYEPCDYGHMAEDEEGEYVLFDDVAALLEKHNVPGS